jgi:hypothetical protein
VRDVTKPEQSAYLHNSDYSGGRYTGIREVISFMLGKSMRLKTVGKVLAGVAVAYAIAAACLYAAMLQPPERFGAIMSHVPMPAMIILPFPPLWMHARAGTLRAGDQAPDFSLPALDRSRSVRLSDELRERPVALIFGSYT